MDSAVSTSTSTPTPTRSEIIAAKKAATAEQITKDVEYFVSHWMRAETPPHLATEDVISVVTNYHQLVLQVPAEFVSVFDKYKALEGYQINTGVHDYLALMSIRDAKIAPDEEVFHICEDHCGDDIAEPTNCGTGDTTYENDSTTDGDSDSSAENRDTDEDETTSDREERAAAEYRYEMREIVGRIACYSAITAFSTLITMVYAGFYISNAEKK